MEHSGSTLLSLLLSAHPRVVSLGEVEKTLRRLAAEPEEMGSRSCLCGEPLPRCPLWGRLWEERGWTEQGLPGGYAALCRAFHELYGPDRVLADSSKIVAPLGWLAADGTVSLKAVFLLKDARSYLFSQRANHRRSGLKPPAAWRLVRDWHRQNRAIGEHLHREGLDHCRISYEEICLAPHLVLPELCSFLGLEFDEAMLAPSLDDAHQIFGNRMRHQPHKNRRIQYDNRWFLDRGASLALALNPVAWRFNRANVYSHTAQGVWSR
jgi:hypothetical protein